MKKRLVALAAVVSLLSVTLTGCGGFGDSKPGGGGDSKAATKSADGVVQLRLAHDNNVNTPLHASFEEFEKLVEEKTDGKIDVVLFPAGQMGSVTDVLEQVRRGDLEMSGTTTSNLVQNVPEFAVWEGYYLFDDYDHAHKVLDSEVGQSVLDPIKEMGLTGLGYMEIGFRNFSNSKTPIEKADDLKGLKMRGYNPLQIKAWEALGAVPTNLAWNEVFTSLQQHLIDGQECATTSFYNEKFYEAQDYWSLTKHTYTNFMVYINSDFMEGLPEDQQTAIREAMDETIKISREKAEAEEESVLKDIEASGTAINEVSNDARLEMGEIMNNAIKDDIVESCGQELYDKVMAEVEANRAS